MFWYESRLKDLACTILTAIILCSILSCVYIALKSNDSDKLRPGDPFDENYTTVSVEKDYTIVYANDTKVMYSITKSGLFGGTVLTVLLDADGNPQIYNKQTDCTYETKTPEHNN